MDNIAVKVMRMMSELRTIIENRRKELNITKTMIYEDTGYGRCPYNQFIEGKNDPSLSNFLRLCEYLHIYLDVQVDGTIKPREPRPKGKRSHKNYVPKPKPERKKRTRPAEDNG